MAVLATEYMGIKMTSPVVVSACSISGRVDNIKRAEAAGAGALVIKSLFEEQILAESLKLESDRMVGSDHFAESLTYFPPLQHAGPRGHLMWVEKSRKAVKMPLLASLNAVTPSAWTGYAKQLEGTGVDGLELNPYAVQTDVRRTGSDVEAELYEIVRNVLAEVTIPVAIKLTPFYTSLVNVAAELDRLGVKGLVLFNRFLQPDIDPERELLRNAMDLSQPEETRLPLRYVALLYGKVKADLAGNTGVHSGLDAVKHILAGAAIVEVASVLYTKKVEHLKTLNDEIGRWMDQKGYAGLSDFRGKLSQEDLADLFAFERAQYVELLLQQVV
jgi:dihydroorotate dehydrogenase (fumarate)